MTEMSSPASGDGSQRLDRIERAIEHLVSVPANFEARLDRLLGAQEAQQQQLGSLQQDHQQLLKAQVVLDDTVERLAEEQRRLAEAQRHSDERLNTLIKGVDDLVRGRPPGA